ncbi:MAG: class I SAM-dependent methyltransferase [Bacteroidia bacterium]
MITDPQQDPLGTAALDYYRGHLKAEIRVISDLAINDVIPARYLFRSYEQMPAWERAALDACRGRVLDIGAGAGSHSLILQTRGHAVTALDVSPGAVELMRLRGVEDVVHGSIWDFAGGPYDTLLLMMNGIGVVGDLSGLNRFLEKARDWLAEGGQILLDSSDISFLYEHDESWVHPPNDRYRGIIRYRMHYRTTASRPFDWLYIDLPRLELHARQFGYTCTCLLEGPHFEYLARLTRA